MKEGMRQELVDFLRFCRSERRLAPMTCSAYERDVSACLDYLQGEGIKDLGQVKVTHLRAFLAEEQKRRPAVSSQARTTAALKCFSAASSRRSESCATQRSRCGRRRSARRCRRR
jgi:site-specific recombinase XerD